MARGGKDKLPSKITFFKQEDPTYGNAYFGPYLTKPTAIFKSKVGEWIVFKLDKEGNYIKQDA